MHFGADEIDSIVVYALKFIFDDRILHTFLLILQVSPITTIKNYIPFSSIVINTKNYRVLAD
jgi:hypothetical protein